MTATTPNHALSENPTAPDTRPPSGTDDRLPLAVGQEAMWVSWKVDPQQRTHIVPSPFLVEGELDTARLAAAVDQLGRRYPTLRARVVREADATWLTWADAPAIPMAEHAADQPLDGAVRSLWQRPFDLDAGPLARVDVVRGQGRTVLLITVHHLVFDGASVLLLLAELRQAYAGTPWAGPTTWHRSPRSPGAHAPMRTGRRARNCAPSGAATSATTPPNSGCPPASTRPATPSAAATSTRSCPPV